MSTYNCENEQCQDTERGHHEAWGRTDPRLWRIDPNHEMHQHSPEWSDGYAAAMKEIRYALANEWDPDVLEAIRAALSD